MKASPNWRLVGQCSKRHQVLQAWLKEAKDRRGVRAKRLSLTKKPFLVAWMTAALSSIALTLGIDPGKSCSMSMNAGRNSSRNPSARENSTRRPPSIGRHGIVSG